MLRQERNTVYEYELLVFADAKMDTQGPYNCLANLHYERWKTIKRFTELKGRVLQSSPNVPKCPDNLNSALFLRSVFLNLMQFLRDNTGTLNLKHTAIVCSVRH